MLSKRSLETAAGLLPETGAKGVVPPIGERLRNRRKGLRMTLKDVADATGLAQSFISQLERGVHTGSIRTLQKICEVLGITVGDLFSDGMPNEPRVRRFIASEGFAFGENASKLRLSPRAFNHLEVFLGIFEPYGSTGVEAYSHGDSEELILVVEGNVDVTVGDRAYSLGALDSLPFSSKLPHRVVETDGAQAKVLWAMAPPIF